jgi:hypothetical protein
MADNKVITLDVQSNIDESAKSVGSLKAQLREAQAEVAALSDKFGATSKEAVEAAKRAGELKDRIGDAKALTDAFNPDAKFKSLTSSLSGAEGGLSAVTGAMGLLGAESENVQSMILKVQSAMAVSTGLQAVGESIDSFKQLRAVVMSYSIVQKISTAAQWLWNTAMAANPLGAIVAVIAAVIAVGYKLITMFMESSAANEQAAAATKKNTAALKEQDKAIKNSVESLKETNDQQYALAKANGASSESLRKLALKHAEEAVALNHKNTMLARSTFLRERDTLASLKANDASDEVIANQEKLVKSAYESFDKQREGLYESYKQRRKVINDNEVAVAQEATDRRNKEVEDAKKHQEDLLEKQKEADKKKKEEDAKKLQDLKDFQKTIRDAEAEDAAQRTAERLAEEENTLNSLNAIAEQQDAIEQESLKKREEAAAKDLEIQKLKSQGQIALMQKTSEVLGTFSDLLGKQTAEGKALAIAQATINAYLGISEVWKAKNVYPEPFGTATKIASTVVIAASAFKTVKDITAVQVPGGGGGGGGSAPSTGGGSAPAAPSFNVVGSSGTNQLAQVMNQQGMPPVQAYVVASNVTSAQSLNRNIVNNATLG